MWSTSSNEAFPTYQFDPNAGNGSNGYAFYGANSPTTVSVSQSAGGDGDFNDMIIYVNGGSFTGDSTYTGPAATYGCMDSNAVNYDPNANVNSLCVYANPNPQLTINGSTSTQTIVEWALNRHIKMAKSDLYWDKDKVQLNGVVFYPTENVVSEERMFRVEQLHYTQVAPLDKIPVYRELPDTPYVQSPYLGTYYYLVNTDRAPVDDVRVRQALSMAVDRDKLVRSVLQHTAVPAYSITPPDTLGYFPPKLFDYDPERARELLAEAGYPGGEGWPGLEIIYNTQEAHRKIAVAIQQMWKSELNIDVTIANQEWKVYLNSVSQRDFQVARRGWIGDYVDANNFLDLFITDGGNNNTGYANAVYDDIILQQAPRAATREERYALFTKAETMLMAEMPIIPIYTYTSKHLIHPSVEGIYPNLMDSLNLKYVSLNPERSLPEGLR